MDCVTPTNADFRRRLSPRLHPKPNSDPKPNLIPVVVVDVEDVDPSSSLQRRLSPRLHPNHSSSDPIMSTPKTPRDFQRRMSPRLHAPDAPKDACQNSAFDIQRRLSPRLHPHPTPQSQEDASKESVIQRRKSARRHSLSSSGKAQLLSNCSAAAASDKRIRGDLDAKTSSSSKKNKLHHSAPVIGGPSHQPSLLREILRASVNKTLRIYYGYYVHFLKEKEKEEENEPKKRKKGKTPKSKDLEGTGTGDTKQTSSRADLNATSLMKKRNEILFPEKRVGDLPGVEVGYQFYSRAEMVAVGIHSHWLSGIDYIGQSTSQKTLLRPYTFPIAVAVVLSGQYEDDRDESEDIVYTGEGGHDLQGSKLQHEDQTLTRGNLAMKNSMEQSVPIRVIRGHDNADSYSGKIYSYDGLYKVEETLCVEGCRGYLVYKFRLKRLEGQPKLRTEQVEFVRGCRDKTSSGLLGLVCQDISNGLEAVPIPVTNKHHDPPVGPAGFTYIKSVEFAEGVKLPPNATGCTCKGNCTNPNTCACAKLNGPDFPYVRRGGGRLHEAKDIVFECGSNCGCGPDCLNRTSQRGLKYRLEVYFTLDKGWAVRTWDFIPSGAPVCEYVGVLRRSDELENIAENDYIFDIDCLHTMNEIEGRERRCGNLPVSVTAALPKIDKKTLDGTPEPEFSIDAGSRGNFTRFINHSCEPNLFVQCILSSHRDPRLARVVLFAADDISPMQELTYDYGYALDSVVGPDGEVKTLLCACGTSECRKRLY